MSKIEVGSKVRLVEFKVNDEVDDLEQINTIYGHFVGTIGTVTKLDPDGAFTTEFNHEEAEDKFSVYPNEIELVVE